MGRQKFLSDFRDVLYSSHGSVQTGVLYDLSTGKDIDGGTVDYLIANYGDAPVYRILAQNNDIVIYTNMSIEEE